MQYVQPFAYSYGHCATNLFSYVGASYKLSIGGDILFWLYKQILIERADGKYKPPLQYTVIS